MDDMALCSGFWLDFVVSDEDKEYDTKKQAWQIQRVLSECASYWSDRARKKMYRTAF